MFTGGQIEQMGRCSQVDRQNRWADGTGGQMGTDGQIEQVDRWNGQTDMNRQTDGMGRQT